MSSNVQPSYRAGKSNSTESVESPQLAPRLNSCSTLPGRSIVPSNWKVILALGFCGVVVWAFVVWLSQSAFARDLGLGEIASLNGGALPRYFSTISLLVTSQLTLLIYWHRSRSRMDFRGRYRVWGWIGLFWCLICLAHALQWHHPVLNWVEDHFQIRCWRGPELIWLVPLSIGVLTVHRLAAREANPFLPSSIAWTCAFVLSLIVGGMHLGLELFLPPDWQAPWRASITMLWHLSLAIFSLIHAYYVTHVTNEFGFKRLTIRSRTGRWIKARLQKLGEAIIGIVGPLVLRLPRPRGTSFRGLSGRMVTQMRKLRLKREKVRKERPAKVKEAPKKPEATPAPAPQKVAGQSPEKTAKPVVKEETKKASQESADENAVPRVSWRTRVSSSLAGWRKRRGEAAESSSEKPAKKQKEPPVVKEAANAAQPSETSAAPRVSLGARVTSSLTGWRKRRSEATEASAEKPAKKVKEAPVVKEAVSETSASESPPAPRVSLGARLSSALAGWRKRRSDAAEERAKKAKEASASKEVVNATSQSKASAPPPKSEQPKESPRPAPEEKKRPAPPVVERAAPPVKVEAPAPVEKRADPPKSRVPGEPHFQKAAPETHRPSNSELESEWVDAEEEDDFDSDRQLSSRERKKLKKLQRQKNRNG